jgi:hypothetical protein
VLLSESKKAESLEKNSNLNAHTSLPCAGGGGGAGPGGGAAGPKRRRRRRFHFSPLFVLGSDLLIRDSDHP